uniref:Uncharacterized protein n=1 Tax=Oscillatoriales cyanobacterium SpSt-402 TaxID=2282168 RepID=A0A832H1J9_9CYAN
MLKEMCWLSPLGTNSGKVLHLRTAPNEPWRPYTAFPQFSVPDHRVSGGSKGWATFQKLLKAGWTLLPSASDNSVVASIKAS